MLPLLQRISSNQLQRYNIMRNGATTLAKSASDIVRTQLVLTSRIILNAPMMSPLLSSRYAVASMR